MNAPPEHRERFIFAAVVVILGAAVFVTTLFFVSS